MTTPPTSTPTNASISGSRRYAMVLLLAVVGGSVDAAVILGFGVLTAAQTGNTILLAVSLVQHQFGKGLHSIISVAGYVAGAALAEMVILKWDEQEQKQRTVLAGLSAELAFIVLLAALWHFADRYPLIDSVPLLVVLAAIAMGMQSATVLRLHSGPKTTYVTGTLTNFTTKAVQSLRALETAPSVLGQRSRDNGNQDHAWMYGLNWMVYAVGAAASGVIFINFHEAALLLSIAALAGAIAVGVS